MANALATVRHGGRRPPLNSKFEISNSKFHGGVYSAPPIGFVGGWAFMQRILLVVVVLLVAWRILAAIGRRLSEKSPGADSFSRFSPDARRRRRQWSGDRRKSVEELVECASCGTFVPTGRALSSGSNKVFCSEFCRQRETATSDNGRG